ncbi:hypothetical protein EV44_g1030 [Erysiphe necator]|uniref:Uncharacterized protein n=1 Tax=Uncinula necator TaxID=52586 RepID=A0A0B1PGB6_UNCNE|nr:hypothetical protein EV44_g1030 [Erysiphe necator]
MVAGDEKPLAKLSAKSTADPIIRNALRYTISVKEYETLHRYVLSRSRIVKKNVPSVTAFEDFVGVKENDERENIHSNSEKGIDWLITRDEYNVATIRESVRVLLGTTVGLKLWNTIKRILGMRMERKCAYGEFILKNSPAYVQNRPDEYPTFLPWPSKYDVINSLAAMSQQKYPKFISPILFPESKPNFPSIAPITNTAHPLITQLSCAAIHPLDHSCLRTYLKNWITVFPQLTRFFTLIFSVLALPRIILHLNKPDSILNVPQAVIGRLIDRILRYSVFVSGAVGTTWASVCLFQSIFSRSFLTETRFFLGGFLGGLWAWTVRRQARSEFIYSLRASILSCWQLGRKRGWWKSLPGGDVLVFIVCLATLNVVFECDRGRGVVNSWMVRSALSGARGYGWNGIKIEEKPKEQLKYETP